MNLESQRFVSRNVRGFVTNLQKDQKDLKVHVNKLPSKPIHEAKADLDLALDYMEIVDKVLDEQKITINPICGRVKNIC